MYQYYYLCRMKVKARLRQIKLCILSVSLLWQTVKSQIKSRIPQYFTRVYIVCLQRKRQGSRVRSRSGAIQSWRLIMKLFLWSFSSLPLIHSRRVVISYKRKYVNELLVNRLFKPVQEKVWLGQLTVPP